MQESYEQTCGNGIVERGEECDCKSEEVRFFYRILTIWPVAHSVDDHFVSIPWHLYSIPSVFVLVLTGAVFPGVPVQGPMLRSLHLPAEVLGNLSIWGLLLQLHCKWHHKSHHHWLSYSLTAVICYFFQVLPSYFLCRAPETECDVPEYCDGISGHVSIHSHDPLLHSDPDQIEPFHEMLVPLSHSVQPMHCSKMENHAVEGRASAIGVHATRMLTSARASGAQDPCQAMTSASRLLTQLADSMAIVASTSLLMSISSVKRSKYCKPSY